MTKYPGFDPAKSYIGECQVCGAFQVVNDGHLVLHGYKRPGDGFIEGRCWGEMHIPFELSCEIAKDFHKHLVEKAIPDALTYLKKLHTPGLDELTISVADGYYPGSGRGWGGSRTIKNKLVKITPGYVHTKGAENDYLEGTTFEQFRTRAIKRQAQGIENLERDRDGLAEKIASWKYAPEKLQTRTEVTAAKKLAQAEKAAWSKFYSNQRSLWKYLADAIRDHKQGYSWSAEKHGVKLSDLPAFPTDKERAAARKGKPAR